LSLDKQQNEEDIEEKTEENHLRELDTSVVVEDAVDTSKEQSLGQEKKQFKAELNDDEV